MGKRAVINVRVSSKEQAETGYSLPSQLEACRRYAAERGFEVAEETIDDCSGAISVAERPGGARVYELLRSGQVDAVIQYTIDRTARDDREYPIEYLIFLRDVQDAGAELHFCDTGKSDGGILDLFRAWKAAEERRDIRERTMRGRRYSAKSGNVMTFGRPPFGYKEVEIDGRRTLAINEAEAKTVRLIFTWYTSGDGENGPSSIRQITRKLSELEIPTYTDLRNERNWGAIGKTRRGKGKWGIGTVSGILSNETYAGVWHFGKRGKGAIIPVEVPAIITREVWEATQERKTHNTAFAKKNTKYQYLLQRRLRCGDCGYRITAHPCHYKDKVYLYYRCEARYLGLSCTMRLNFRADVVDALAWDWVESLLTDEVGLKESLRKYQEQQEELNRPLRDKLETVNDLVAEREEQLGRLLDLYLDGDFDKEMLVERKQRLETALTGLHEEQTRLTTLLREQELSEEHIMGILEFAQVVREGIEEADEDFEARRRFAELLDVTGELSIEDGEKVLYLHCRVGDTHLSVANTSTCARCPPG